MIKPLPRGWLDHDKIMMEQLMCSKHGANLIQHFAKEAAILLNINNTSCS
jgi:porphobilinogen synthase